jgi:hypothetical protein
MKFFLDTEFIEGAKQRRFLGFNVGAPVPTIDLISIGLVAEDGREFYALNAECELGYAWANEWVRQNVLLPIWHKNVSTALKYSQFMPFSLSTMKHIFKEKGRTKQQLTSELYEFVFPLQWLADELNKVLTMPGCDVSGGLVRGPGVGEYYDRGEAITWLKGLSAEITPEFWAYYADYDWVVFCQLFGRMLDLPKGFPMFCHDLKQELSRLGITSEQKQALCPDPEGEHDALVDARWDKQLHGAMRVYALNNSDGNVELNTIKGLLHVPALGSKPVVEKVKELLNYVQRAARGEKISNRNEDYR